MNGLINRFQLEFRAGLAGPLACQRLPARRPAHCNSPLADVCSVKVMTSGSSIFPRIPIEVPLKAILFSPKDNEKSRFRMLDPQKAEF